MIREQSLSLVTHPQYWHQAGERTTVFKTARTTAPLLGKDRGKVIYTTYPFHDINYQYCVGEYDVTLDICCLRGIVSSPGKQNCEHRLLLRQACRGVEARLRVVPFDLLQHCLHAQPHVWLSSFPLTRRSLSVLTRIGVSMSADLT